MQAGQEALVRTGHGTTDWFKIGKGVQQGCVLSPCLFNFYSKYISEMLGWMNHKLESIFPGEISTMIFVNMKFRCADDTTIIAEREE